MWWGNVYADMNHKLITILGPTASGKTTLATRLAAHLGDAEVISADSRQVYRGMDVGTGKDLSDYVVGDKCIPYHLIDICELGEDKAEQNRRRCDRIVKAILSRRAHSRRGDLLADREIVKCHVSLDCDRADEDYDGNDAEFNRLGRDDLADRCLSKLESDKDYEH